MEMTGEEYSTVIGDASQQQQHHQPKQRSAPGQRAG